MDLSPMTSSPSLPRLLLVEPHVPTAESLIHLFHDRRLKVDYEVSTSFESAARKLFRSPVPYQVVVSHTDLAIKQGFLLLDHNRTLQPFVPFIVTASAAERGSARQALERGAFDLIPTPLDQEQTAETLRLALWHNTLRTLIARSETAAAKYRDHLAAYPDSRRPDVEDGFMRACALIDSTLALAEQIEKVSGHAAEVVARLESQIRDRAFDRLNLWPS